MTAFTFYAGVDTIQFDTFGPGCQVGLLVDGAPSNGFWVATYSYSTPTLPFAVEGAIDLPQAVDWHTGGPIPGETNLYGTLAGIAPSGATSVQYDLRDSTAAYVPGGGGNIGYISSLPVAATLICTIDLDTSSCILAPVSPRPTLTLTDEYNPGAGLNDEKMDWTATVSPDTTATVIAYAVQASATPTDPTSWTSDLDVVYDTVTYTDVGRTVGALCYRIAAYEPVFGSYFTGGAGWLISSPIYACSGSSEIPPPVVRPALRSWRVLAT